jgi:D-alanyl-D-alanine carboxypeptidase/D-alanyl-D-alanine-endopeptidase (penicillin-binding protein 4)
MVGDALLKSIGSSFGPAGAPDLLTAGQAVLREYVGGLGTQAAAAAGLDAQPGFFAPAVELFDGSGLSHASHVTTDALMALLLDLRAQSDFGVVWDALPIAGVDGTLEYRMRKTPAQGVLRAKTGTLDGAYNLSGYVPRKAADGSIAEFVPFVILTHTTAAEEVAAHQAEDRIGAALAQTLNPDAKP